MAKDVDGPALVELGHDPVEEAALGVVGVTAVQPDQPGPRLGLGGSEEGEQLGAVEASIHVDVAGLAPEVAPVVDQPPLDGVLERLLRVPHAVHRLPGHP